MCINNGWDLTFSESQYWSTLETTKRYVYKILLPYLNSQMNNLHQKMILVVESLVNTQKKRVFRLDETSPQHYGHLHTIKHMSNI
jgi:hypothetical protein